MADVKPLPLLPNASLIMEAVDGFPQCPSHNNYSIIGDAKDAVLEADGGLQLNHVHLPMGQYCIEKMEETEQPAKVIACSEHVLERYLQNLKNTVGIHFN